MYDIVWDVGEVQEDHNHVGLLVFIHILLRYILRLFQHLEAVLDDLFPFCDKGSDIVEFLCVNLV